MSRQESPEETYYDAVSQPQSESSQAESSSNKHTYYELEKVDDSDEEVDDLANDQNDDGRSLGKLTTIPLVSKMADSGKNVFFKIKSNVLHRARLFEHGDKKQGSKTDGKQVKFQIKSVHPAPDTTQHTSTVKTKQGSTTGNPADPTIDGHSDHKPPNVGGQYDQIWPKDLAPGVPDPSPYEFAKQILEDPQTGSTDKKPSQTGLQYSSAPVPLFGNDNQPSSQSARVSHGVNKGVQSGAGPAVPVDFVHPKDHLDHNTDDQTEYSKFYLRSVNSEWTGSQRQRMLEQGYSSLATLDIGDNEPSPDLPLPPVDGNSDEDMDDVSLDWGSEFDEFSYQDDFDDVTLDDSGTLEMPDKPLPQKPGKGKFSLGRGNKFMTLTRNRDDPSTTSCWPVTINPEKHPPPMLPAAPENLTEDQKKRRCVIELIIQSEKSYLESLERIIEVYQHQVLEYLSHPKAHIRPVFAEMREIISHHKMFQIELSESVRLWDQQEKIGDIFTASFSKTMLVNSYSIYVNNFAAAMEEIRSVQRNRQSFAEFLKKQEKLSPDRLSIFGLMVKPVQRFPQFIMCLQDLIKYTPQSHHDRRALQLALTELENVTHKLNERKRHSEQCFQAKQALQQLTRQKVQHVMAAWNIELDSKRRLLRMDPVEQVFGEFGNMKCKDRRLILMNDLVLCVKVIEKDHSGYPVERLALRWMAKLRDLELKETSITPEMHRIIKKEPEKIHIISTLPDKPEEDPFHLYADLKEMLHDYSTLGQIADMVNSLKRSYLGYGLSTELIHEVTRDLQRMIQIKDEQLRLVNSCSVLLVDSSKSEQPHYVLQTATAAIKQDWVVDFLMAKLALEKSNRPAWDGPISSDDVDFDRMPAHYMKCVNVDMPRNYIKIRCAVPIFLSPDNAQTGIGVQHVWVCSSNPNRGQVSVLSIHNSKPALTEAFRACDCEIWAAELVPGCGSTTDPEHYLFAEDTVWICTAHSEILVFPLVGGDGVRRDPISVIHLPSVAVSVKFVDERLFLGSDIGSVSVYSRTDAGSWDIANSKLLTFGTMPVKFQFVQGENLWLSCDRMLMAVEIDSLDTKITHNLSAMCTSPIDFVVRSGVGLWMSFHDSSVIKLFHSETLDNLQEMSIGHFITRIRQEKLWTLNGSSEVVVTALAVSKGLLWIGTSIGVVLTLPLPRLSDGVPLYRGRPSVSLHSHRGPVRFFSQFPCGQSTTELRRSSSLRSTLSSRRSPRNLERERIELEESEKRRRQEQVAVTLPPTSMKRGDNLSQMTQGQQGKDDVPSSSTGRRKLGAAGSMSDLDQLKQWEVSAGMGSRLTTDQLNGSNNQLTCSKSGRGKDDSDSVMLRKSKSSKESRASRSSKTLSFRSELAQRIMSYTMSRSELPGPLEVEMLYENLLEGDLLMEDDLGTGSQSCLLDSVQELPSPPISVSDNGTISSMVNVSPLSTLDSGQVSISSTLDAGQVSISSTLDSGQVSISSTLDAGQMSISSTLDAGQMSISSTLDPDQKVSISSTLDQNTSAISGSVPAKRSPSRQSNLSRQNSNRSITQTFRRMATLRHNTSRRPTCNAVVILSGGDGYCDLDMSRSVTKFEDACVMFWLYKF